MLNYFLTVPLTRIEAACGWGPCASFLLCVSATGKAPGKYMGDKGFVERTPDLGDRKHGSRPGSATDKLCALRDVTTTPNPQTLSLILCKWG